MLNLLILLEYYRMLNKCERNVNTPATKIENVYVRELIRCLSNTHHDVVIMKLFRILLVFLPLCLFFIIQTQAQTTVTGTVYWDKNENGLFESAEKGLPEVAVSNGREVVLTNENGEYKLDIDDKDGKIFVIKPVGYEFPTDEFNRPQFYYLHKPDGSPNFDYPGVQPTGPLPESVNFPLFKSKKKRDFSILLIADPQPADREEIDFFDRDIISELVDTKQHEFGITLGDMVDRGQLELFKPYSKAIAKVGIPWFHVFGNNDMNFAAKSDGYADETFEATFGPATYSFNYGNTHFIVLDNILYPRPDEPGGLSSGITAKQLGFIENDLEHVSDDKLVVLASHIPFYGSFPDADRRQLFQLLERYPNTLSVSGHRHMQQFHFFDIEQGWPQLKPHIHYTVGSASGLRWSGVPDERGIPPAIMRDGTPNGYAILNIKGNSFTIDYKAANKPDNYRMSIWGPEVVPQNTSHFAQFYVNYFLGNEYTDLEYRVKESENWRSMRRVEEPDPHLTAVRTKWDTSKEVLEGFRPFNPTESTHLWTAFVPNDLPLGEQEIEIRVTDMFGRSYTDEFAYKIVKPTQ